MGCLIARVQKYKAGDVKGMEIHDTREKGHSHTNKDIDWGKVEDNYDLHHPNGYPSESWLTLCKNRIAELDLPRAVRKDAVVMVGVLVTSDSAFFKDMNPMQTRAFFKDAYQFLCDYYGKENIISATVHVCEKTPHMHVNLVPVTPDGRLSAKDLFTPDTLKGTGRFHEKGKHKGKEIMEKVHGTGTLSRFQDKMFEHIGKPWGMERGEVGSTRRHIKTPEFKKVTEAITAAEAELEARQAQIAALDEEIEVGNKKNKNITKLLDTLEPVTAGVLNKKVVGSKSALTPGEVEEIAEKALKTRVAINDRDKAIAERDEAVARLEGVTEREAALEAGEERLKIKMGEISETITAAKSEIKADSEFVKNANITAYERDKYKKRASELEGEIATLKASHKTEVEALKKEVVGLNKKIEVQQKNHQQALEDRGIKRIEVREPGKKQETR